MEQVERIPRSRRHRSAGSAIALLALGAGVLLAACAGHTAEEQANSAYTITHTLAPDHAAPRAEAFTATFDQAKFTTTYTARVTLPLAAEDDRDSGQLHASWTGPNCGSAGIVNFLGAYQQGTNEWDFGYARDNGPAGEAITYRWTHPHPPCGDTPDHRDVTIKLVVSNKFGAVTCTYVGAASGPGECK